MLSKQKRVRLLEEYSSVNRWLKSTSAKDIGVLYMVFAGIAGIIGSS